MSKININRVRRNYLAPAIQKVSLDNEISLALQSLPPVGPDELVQKSPDYFRMDPFDNQHLI
jgi:hypothetical protein